MAKKILLFEDNRRYSEGMVQELQSAGFEVELVDKIPDTPLYQTFQQILSRAHEFSAIIWDSVMNSETHPMIKTTQGYIQAFKQIYPGPMIACSSHPDERLNQKDAGCTHECDKHPMKLVPFMKALLK